MKPPLAVGPFRPPPRVEFKSSRRAVPMIILVFFTPLCGISSSHSSLVLYPMALFSPDQRWVEPETKK